MDTLFDKLFSIFSLEFMFAVIMGTYFVIKIIDFFNGDKVIPTWVKRVVTFSVGVLAFVVFKMFTGVSVECLIASFFAAVFIYDVAIKIIIKKFNIDYRK